MAAVSKVPCVGFGYLVLTALLEARRGAGFSKRPCFRCVCSRAWRVWEQAQQINQGLEAAAVGTFPPHLRNIRYNNWPTYTCIATGDEDWVTRWRDIEIHSRWGVFCFCLLRYCRYHEIFFFTTFLCSVFVTPAANDTSSFRSCFWAIVVNNENKQSAIDVQNDTFVYRVTPFKVALVWTLWWLKLELKGAQRGSPCPSTETSLQLNEQPFLVGGCDVYSISVSGKTFSR